MTITTTINRRVYNGAGIVGPFAVDFKFLLNADIKVSKTLIATGVATPLAEGADYVLTGAGVAGGGSLNLTVALDPTFRLTIYRDPVQDQQTQFPPNDKFPAAANENALDKLTMLCQRFLDVFARTSRLSDTDVSGADVTLPTPVAGQIIGWKADLSGLQNYALAGALAVSAYGQTLLNSLNAGAARALLLSTAVGDALFIAASATAARITLGFSAIAAKGDLFTGTAANTIGTLTVGADGKVLTADSSQASGLSYIDDLSRPNLLINPNWQIDQINEGALYTMNGAAANGPDGWSGEAVGAGGGVFKLRTLADPDNAALKCLEITCTTVDAAPGAAVRYDIFTAVEGYDAAALMAGTASAQAIIVQFKFKSNVNGTYGLSIANSAKNRSYVGAFVVANANENEYTVKLTLDTAGVWLYTNGVGLYMRLTLAAGVNSQAVAGAWNAADNYCTAAQVNFMSNIANIAYLKRIQLIPGSLVQAYRPADIQKELAKAQRYYNKTFPQGTAVAQNAGAAGAIQSDFAYANTAGIIGTWDFAAVMRATPTITTYAPDAATANWSGTINRSLMAASDRRVPVQGDTNTGLGTAYTIHATANARLS